MKTPTNPVRFKLVNYLGFPKDRPKPNNRALTALSRSYLAHDKDFAKAVAKPLGSGDPMVVEKALQVFAQDFRTFLDKHDKKTKTDSGISANSCNWKGCFAISLYAVANAAVYANVAAATEVAATLVLAWFYLMDDQAQDTQIEKDHLVSLMTSSLRPTP